MDKERWDIECGDFFAIKGIKYTILEKEKYGEDVVVTCIVRDETKRIRIRCFSEMELNDLLKAGELVLEKVDLNIPIEKLSNNDIAIMNRRKEVIDDALDLIYSRFEVFGHRKAKEIIQYIEKELSIKESFTRVLLSRYLKSGMNQYSLLDQRIRITEEKKYRNNVTGRSKSDGTRSKVPLNELTLNNFEEAFKYYKKNCCIGVSVLDAYDWLLDAHYSDDEKDEFLPEDECPSYNRFSYYVRNQLEGVSARKYSRSEREKYNNDRKKRGSYLTNVYYPGQVMEMDEVEVDITLVRYRGGVRQIIGRPIVYFLVDVITQTLAAFSCALHNNSYIGFLNCFETLFTKHSLRAEKMGLVCDDSVIPSCFLPKTIRTDQGAEYDSAILEEKLRLLGITHEITKPATGSMKGIVESSFHSFQQNLRSNLRGSNGYIRKNYDSDHLKAATLTMEDFQKMLFLFVEYHNTKVLDNYPLTPDQAERKLKPTPINLWNYYSEVEKSTIVRKIKSSDIPDLRYKLMLSDKTFKVSLDGITCGEHLFYWIEDQEIFRLMNKAGNKKKEISSIRYDPRSIDFVYLMRRGKLIEISLNTQKANLGAYKGYSWKAFEDSIQSQRELKQGGRTGYEAAVRRRKYRQENEQIIAKAKEKSKGTEICKKDIRESRNIERMVQDNLDAEKRNSIYEECSEEEITMNEKDTECANDNDFGDDTYYGFLG